MPMDLETNLPHSESSLLLLENSKGLCHYKLLPGLMIRLLSNVIIKNWKSKHDHIETHPKEWAYNFARVAVFHVAPL